MAALLSPGVDVTVTDESFFIPTAAPTVPLIFIATEEAKEQPTVTVNPTDNLANPGSEQTSGVIAEGTTEHHVIRTVTSIRRSIELYGIPRFLEETSEDVTRQYHGDARNEYGLLALNQFLGIGSSAFVVRADVNLNDDIDAVRDLWEARFAEAAVVVKNLAQESINTYNIENGLNENDIGSSPAFKQTITPAEFLSYAEAATADIFAMYSFNHHFSSPSQTLQDYYIDDQSASPLPLYPNGYNAPPVGSYDGLTPMANSIASYPGYSGGGTIAGEFTPDEAHNLLIETSDDFKFTQEFRTGTSLGANDAARRVAITESLKQAIQIQEVQAENFEYNLILCPGYHECVETMRLLSVNMKEEALVIGDPPVDKAPDQMIGSNGWNKTTARVIDNKVAYYYPWCLTTNLDGVNVVGAPSGTALRTYAYSDNNSYVWFAPAGVQRGTISGVSGLGYVSGQLGTPTTFNEVHLDKGMRDNFYWYYEWGAMNPLVFFPGRGFLVWGQRTSTGITASALDRVNVRRLIMHIARQLRKHTLPFVFEPNDKLTRDNLKAAVDNFLGDLIVKRGLYDFATVCDESNNTPDRIDRNEMYIDVALKPVKAAEFIYIPIRVLATGAEI